MIYHISHITLLVHDQEKAAQFYTEKLGFVITESHKLPEGNGYLWITVAPSKNATTMFTLVTPTNDEEKALVGKQAGSIPLCVLITDDCRTTAQEMQSRGVEFTKMPTDEFWGIDALCKDLYGNLIDICQPTKE